MSAADVLPSGHATSAIPGMTVAEIRRALSCLRELWMNATPNNPLFICDKLHNNKSIAEFAKEFVFGHHLKRHLKSVMQANINKRKSHVAPAAAKAVVADAAPVTATSVGATAASTSTAVPGPKGDAGDPFPFTSAWRPKTQRGKRAFETVSATEMPVETKRTTRQSKQK